MAQVFNEGLARAHIKTVIEAVTDIGVVHDYERFADDWETLVAFFVSELSDEITRLRGWTIQLATIDPIEQKAFGALDGTKKITEVTYNYTIRGFMAEDDANASQKTMSTMAMSIISGLNAKAELHAPTTDDGANGNFFGPPAGPARFDWRQFGEVLCNYCEIGVTAKEDI